MEILKYVFVLFLFVTTSTSEPSTNATGRVFNVLNVVQFPNNACKMGSGKDGVCYSGDECEAMGGEPAGVCANGFGVCCYIEKTCGDTTSVNNTYLKRIEGKASPCILDICKMQEDICQIRLDFHQFSLDGPESTRGSDAANIAMTVCQKSQFRISGDGAAGPVICGENTGYHMIVEAEDNCNEIRVTFTESSVKRALEVQVSQIACTDQNKAPEGCTQWYTGVSDTIYSYNYLGGSHLASQEYIICIRREEGYCSNTYYADSESFKVSGTTAASSKNGADCTTDYIFIPRARKDLSKLKSTDRICGTYLGFGALETLYTDRYPFMLGVSFDADEDPGTTTSTEAFKGFAISYEQILACGTQ